MADVATVAGVSHQTVSRVINNHPAVHPDTRARVLAAIDELGYRRNTAARTLVTRRSGIIGVVTFDTTLYGPASTLYGIEQAARAAGYFVAVASTKSMHQPSVLDALERLRDQEVEGAIVIAPQREAVRALSTLPRDLPMVAVEGGSGAGLPVVAVDQTLGSRLVVDHLIAAGAPSVWHVAGPGNWLEARSRTTTWRRRLSAAGLPIPEPIFGDWSAASGYDAGKQLAQRRDVRAVFVANDQMALGVLRAFYEAGLRVPEDVAVAGFDDIPESAYFTPPLTTVRQDFAEVGRKSMEMLLHQIAGSGAAGVRRFTVQPDLIIRQSTHAPPP